MLYAVLLGLFLPLVSFLGLMSASNIIGRRLTGFIACASVLISFVCFSSLLWIYTNTQMQPQTFFIYHWIPVSGIDADFTLYIDPLALLMTLIITGIGFLIHLYSIGYIEHEEDFARYFACLNFFIFAMLLLVLAGNLLLLFAGWEGVGLASYLLVGYWYHRPAAAQAATKAFVVNRIGDCGFLIALLLTFQIFGTGEITDVTQRVAQLFAIGAPLLTLMTFLYFVGAMGKSAQLPLQVWLPDAMEGPTPVSALIHAATMVTAGVYLVVRMHDVYLLTPLTLYIIAIIGAATALFAALCALAQTDLKRVLAYSTISQLGYMFLACGVGAFYAGMFHLTTHAFVKALLFLAAGNVVHMMHGSTNMDYMGGLWKIFFKTRWLFLIGAIALAGIPPLAIFFSKDLILEQVHHAGYELLFYTGLLTSILTAFYMTRAYYLTFLGKTRLEEKIIKVVEEAPSIMTGPVTALAVLSIIGGFLGYAFGAMPPLESFLHKVGIGLPGNQPSGNFVFTLETLASTVGALLAIALAYTIYSKYAQRLGAPLQVLKKAFYIDQIYDLLFVNPLKFVASLITRFIEPKMIEGSILATAHGTQKTARWLQQMQSGQIRSYVAWMAIGMALLIVYMAF